MTDTTTNFDFNTAGSQRDFELIPAQSICTLQMTIRRGGVGDDGWLKRSANQASEYLDCEFVVVDGPHAKKKLWQNFVLQGTTPGHAEAGEISRNIFRAILESARGIRPDDKSEAAQLARKVSSWTDFDQLRFVARLGVEPPKDGYAAKNKILQVITPGAQAWTKPDQISAQTIAPGAAPAPAAAASPANAVTRPEWGR